ncbi:MAG: KEOPS complex subunit Pcc1, partial [Candidatus Bathyarchaeia archaeon]
MVIVVRDAERAIRAEVEVPFRSRSGLRAIKAAMIVDEREPPTSRVSVRTLTRGRRLVLQISADDISSLRAALNSNLRLVLTWI